MGGQTRSIVRWRAPSVLCPAGRFCSLAGNSTNFQLTDVNAEMPEALYLQGFLVVRPQRLQPVTPRPGIREQNRRKADLGGSDANGPMAMKGRLHRPKWLSQLAGQPKQRKQRLTDQCLNDFILPEDSRHP
jgi:hypothetical protein